MIRPTRRRWWLAVAGAMLAAQPLGRPAQAQYGVDAAAAVVAGDRLDALTLRYFGLVETGRVMPSCEEDAPLCARLRECMADPSCGAGLREEADRRRPSGAKYAGELLLLQQDLRQIDRGLLDESGRVDFDILAWQLELGIADELQPEISDYEIAIWRHTGEHLSPEEVHDLGLREVERIRARMEELVAAYDADAKLGDFLEAARTDARLFADSREELLAHARSTSARIQRHLAELLPEVPSVPFQIVTPGGRRGPGYMAWYQGPGAGPGARGYVMLNPDPRQVPLFVLDALLLHEAIPGHHFQFAHAAENVVTPAWRRRLNLTAYVEGWGLYAESLGDALGVYRHPMSEFGRLNLEMWRAIRLVVDTGLHAFEWSRERAEQFFVDNTALPLPQVRVEVRRYADNPGQAVGYKFGERRLLAMRARAEEALRPTFDVRDFHDVILRNGPALLATLDDFVDAWIASSGTADQD